MRAKGSAVLVFWENGAFLSECRFRTRIRKVLQTRNFGEPLKKGRHVELPACPACRVLALPCLPAHAYYACLACTPATNLERSARFKGFAEITGPRDTRAEHALFSNTEIPKSLIVSVLPTFPKQIRRRVPKRMLPKSDI